MPGTLIAIGFGALFVGLGLAGLFLTLFNTHRKRRCPWCGYDRSSIESLTCSECGRTAPNERALHRLPRRGPRLLGSILIVIVGALLVSWPAATNRSVCQWVQDTPSSILVVLFQYCDSDNGVLESAIVMEVYKRMAHHIDIDTRFNGWQRRWVISRCVTVITDHLEAMPPLSLEQWWDRSGGDEPDWNIRAGLDKLMFGHICEAAVASYEDIRADMLGRLVRDFGLEISVLTPTGEQWLVEEVARAGPSWQVVIRPGFLPFWDVRATGGTLISPPVGEQPWWMAVGFDEDGSGVIDCDSSDWSAEPGRYDYVYEVTIEVEDPNWPPAGEPDAESLWYKAGTFTVRGTIELVDEELNR